MSAGHQLPQPGNKPPQLSALEEDDEFEDFPLENWTEADEDHEDAVLWDDNWDDEDLNDEFTRQLRAELLKPTNENQSSDPQQQQQQQQQPQQQ